MADFVRNDETSSGRIIASIGNLPTPSSLCGFCGERQISRQMTPTDVAVMSAGFVRLQTHCPKDYKSRDGSHSGARNCESASLLEGKTPKTFPKYEGVININIVTFGNHSSVGICQGCSIGLLRLASFMTSVKSKIAFVDSRNDFVAMEDTVNSTVGEMDICGICHASCNLIDASQRQIRIWSMGHLHLNVEHFIICFGCSSNIAQIGLLLSNWEKVRKFTHVANVTFGKLSTGTVKSSDCVSLSATSFTVESLPPSSVAFSSVGDACVDAAIVPIASSVETLSTPALSREVENNSISLSLVNIQPLAMTAGSPDRLATTTAVQAESLNVAPPQCAKTKNADGDVVEGLLSDVSVGEADGEIINVTRFRLAPSVSSRRKQVSLNSYEEGGKITQGLSYHKRVKTAREVQSKKVNNGVSLKASKSSPTVHLSRLDPSKFSRYSTTSSSCPSTSFTQDSVYFKDTSPSTELRVETSASSSSLVAPATPSPCRGTIAVPLEMVGDNNDEILSAKRTITTSDLSQTMIRRLAADSHNSTIMTHPTASNEKPSEMSEESVRPLYSQPIMTRGESISTKNGEKLRTAIISAIDGAIKEVRDVRGPTILIEKPSQKMFATKFGVSRYSVSSRNALSSGGRKKSESSSLIVSSNLSKRVKSVKSIGVAKDVKSIRKSFSAAQTNNSVDGTRFCLTEPRQPSSKKSAGKAPQLSSNPTTASSPARKKGEARLSKSTSSLAPKMSPRRATESQPSKKSSSATSIRKAIVSKSTSSLAAKASIAHGIESRVSTSAALRSNHKAKTSNSGPTTKLLKSSRSSNAILSRTSQASPSAKASRSLATSANESIALLKLKKSAKPVFRSNVKATSRASPSAKSSRSIVAPTNESIALLTSKKSTNPVSLAKADKAAQSSPAQDQPILPSASFPTSLEPVDAWTPQQDVKIEPDAKPVKQRRKRSFFWVTYLPMKPEDPEKRVRVYYNDRQKMGHGPLSIKEEPME